MDSILTSIKKLLGIAEEYTQFDSDIIMFINDAFSSLAQLGVGPPNGFRINDKSTTWKQFLSEDDVNFERVKTYVHLKVKLVFDPPDRTAVLESIKQMIAEHEWRLNVAAETKESNGEEELQNG